DEHARGADGERQGLIEPQLHSGRRGLRCQPADGDPGERDAVRDSGRWIRDRGGGGEQQAGAEEEDVTLHVVNAVKILGSIVMIPSAPARTSRSASAGSSTVQT